MNHFAKRQDRSRPSAFKKALQVATSALALSAMSAGGLAYAQSTEAEAAVAIDIPSLPLRDALEYFTVQSGALLAAPDGVLDGRMSRAVRGDLNPAEALRALLDGTGLSVTRTAGGVFTIYEATQAGSPITEIVATTEQIVVRGRRLDSLISIDRKRLADQVLDSISAAESSRMPDNNIAESLGRIPGVSFQRSQETGNGDFISIRGLDAALNNVQFDGVNSGQASAANRRVALEGITSDNIAELQVIKSLLPVDEGEGIGGAVRVISRTPLDYDENTVRTYIEGRYNEFAERGSHRVGGTAVYKINEDLGILVGASHRRRYIHNFFMDASSTNLRYLPELFDADGNRVSNDLVQDQLDDPGTSFDNVSENFLPIEAMTFEEYTYELQEQVRDTMSLNGAIEWNVSPSTTLVLGGRFSQQEAMAVENSLAFDSDDADFEEVDGQLITEFRDQEIDFESQIEDQKETNATFYLRGETELERWSFDYQANYAFADETEAQTDIDFDTGGLIDDYRVGRDIGGTQVNFHPWTYVNGYFPVPNLAGVDSENFREALSDIGGTQILDDFTDNPVNERENKRYGVQFNATYKADWALFGGMLTDLQGGFKAERSTIRDDHIETVVERPDLVGLDGSYRPGEDGAVGEDLADFNLLGRGASLSPIGDPLASVGLHELPRLDQVAFRQFIQNFRDSFKAQGGEPYYTNFFDSREDLYAAYLQATFETGNFVLRGGARIEYFEGQYTTPLDVDAEVETTNYNAADPESPLTNTISLSQAGQLDAVTAHTENFEVLPRFSALYRASDKLQFRAGLGWSLARPTFSQLGKATSVSIDLVGEADQAGDTPILPNVETLDQLLSSNLALDDLTKASIYVRSGNSELKNAKAMNIDFTAEYYPQAGTALTIGVFYKEIDNFIFLNHESDEGTFDPAFTTSLLSAAGQQVINQLGGLETIINSDILDDVTISQPQNGGTAEVYGIELGVHHQFENLPGLLSNVGFSGNVTFTESEASYLLVPGATEANPEGGLDDDEAMVVLGYAQKGDALVRTTDFFNAPTWSSNATLFYEDERFELALSASYQDASFNYTDDFGFDQYYKEHFQLDVYAEYNPSRFDNVSMYLEIPDVTDGGQKPSIVETVGRGNSLYDGAAFNGREIRFGMRARF